MTEQEKCAAALEEMKSVKEFLEVELDGDSYWECQHIAHGIGIVLRKLDDCNDH